MAKKKARLSSKKIQLRAPTTSDDFKNSLLLVSLTINVIILIGWIALQVTSKYDAQVAQFLFG